MALWRYCSVAVVYPHFLPLSEAMSPRLTCTAIYVFFDKSEKGLDSSKTTISFKINKIVWIKKWDSKQSKTKIFWRKVHKVSLLLKSFSANFHHQFLYGMLSSTSSRTSFYAKFILFLVLNKKQSLDEDVASIVKRFFSAAFELYSWCAAKTRIPVWLSAPKQKRLNWHRIKK